MQEVTHKRCIDEVLVDLEQTLRDERTYLLALDATSIDALNPRKSGLERELLAFAPRELLDQRERLDTVRRQLQENLVLLIHARDEVQHRLGIDPQPVIVGTRPSSPAAAGKRLNLRG
jgi:hypothetical protein